MFNKMVSIKVALVSCVHFIASATSTPVQRLCPLQNYLDIDTGLCEPCTDICDVTFHYARAQCSLTCPDKTSPDRSVPAPNTGEVCPRGTYLDEDTLRCDACADLCREKEEQGCTRLCPDYLAQVEESKGKIVLLWSVVAVLSVVLVVMVIALGVRVHIIRRGKQYKKRHGPYIVPYSILGTEKPHDRVNQWVGLLHPLHGEIDSCYGSKSSLIYNPPKVREI